MLKRVGKSKTAGQEVKQTKSGHKHTPLGINTHHWAFVCFALRKGNENFGLKGGTNPPWPPTVIRVKRHHQIQPLAAKALKAYKQICAASTANSTR